MSEHWLCPECGTFDGPHHEGECTVCWHDGPPDASIPRVERLVPAQQLRGAVEALREAKDYLIGAVHDGPIRYEQALDIIDAAPAAAGGESDPESRKEATR
jgi:hypothetical protein